MKNVLIVDDQLEMHDLYQDFFKSNFGRTNLTFSLDGIEAYMRLSAEKYDVITLDHEMPRLKGLELLVALRNTEGLNQKTPVIIISAFIPDCLENLPALENVYFLSKPFHFDALGTYIDNHTSLVRLVEI